MNVNRMLAYLSAAAFVAPLIFVQTTLVYATNIAAGEPVKGEAIKTLVAGKRIYLSVPLGGEMPLHYKEEGVVDGSGEAIGLGKFLRQPIRGAGGLKTTVYASNGKAGMAAKFLLYA